MTRPRPSRPDQRGVALLTVLAVIAFTGLVIGALFGLLSTSMRVTESAERSAREARAADAAVETAINRMRERRCTTVDQSYLTDVVFDQGTPATGDDVTVDVICSPQDEGGGTDQVRIVGTEGYQGDLAWTTDCAVTADEGCLAWSDALDPVPTDLAGRNLSLIHSGDRALRFGSGVSVRTGAAALRSDPDSPAIRVGGQYQQGDAGLGASGTECGVLAGTPGDGRGRIDDVDGEPECGSDEVRSIPVVGSGSGVVVTGPPDPPPPPVCPAGDVVTFHPGRYTSDQTDLVTALTDGGCTDRTFHFLPGGYEFQGDELAFGDPGSFYVFGAASGWSPSTGLVGTDLGSEPDAVLCDTTQSGASIVLNGRTELRHTGGRVAICPAIPAADDGSELAPHAAIQQNPVVPTEVEVTDVQTTGWGNGIGEVDFRCRPFGVFPTTADYPNGLGGVCRPQRRYDLQLETQGRGPVDSLRVMITANESESTPNNLVENRATRLTLSSPQGIVCSTGWPPPGQRNGMPNGSLTWSIDMMEHGTCATTQVDQRQLDRGRIQVDHQMTLPVVSVRQPFTFAEAAVEVNAVSGTPSSVDGSGGGGAAGYDQADRVLSNDGSRAEPQMPAGCTNFLCPFDDGGTFTTADRFVHEIEVGGFTWPAPFDGSTEIDPQISTLRALVRVGPSSSSLPQEWPLWLRNLLKVENFLIPAETSLQLTTPSGNRCMVQGTGMNSDQELAFDLLNASYEVNDGSGCSILAANTMEDLRGATLTLRFSMPCLRDYVTGNDRCLREDILQHRGPIWQFRPPGIEHIRLTTVTDTYSGRAPGASVTVDVTDQARSSAFNVYGRTWLPLSDLTLRWNGGAGATPIFGGNLTVHALASRMAPDAEMGVVCCAPPESRTVELTARVGTTDRVVAKVAFTDVDSDGSYRLGAAVDVLDWRTCNGDGCSDVVTGIAATPPEDAEPDG